ncbi:MAG: hypothetical protein MMC23_003767 [Stictis urceolatum]|nr:hypothetical protein [Stictis urceolata]
MNIVRETAPDQYTSTSLSKAFTEPKYRDGLIYTYDVAGPSFRSMPDYLKSISYDHPGSIVGGPFQYAHKTDGSFFAWLAQNPPYGGLFASYMGGYRAGMPFWADEGFYPFNKRLVDGFDGESALLVDVGGGDGHDLLELLGKHGEVPGKLVLQDQESVISKVIEAGTKGFETTTHDFFEEQPVKGARAYYLHSVLHDWDDDSCKKILRQIVLAMKRNYSRILINELIIPEENASWGTTSMDWLMMALGAVKERTDKDWRSLLESVGLKVCNIWECPFDRATEGLIEAELA